MNNLRNLARRLFDAVSKTGYREISKEYQALGTEDRAKVKMYENELIAQWEKDHQSSITSKKCTVYLKVRLSEAERALLKELCKIYSLPTSHSGMITGLDLAMACALETTPPIVKRARPGPVPSALNVPLTPKRVAMIEQVKERIMTTSGKVALMFCARHVTFLMWEEAGD